jgi:hypothetical protein
MLCGAAGCRHVPAGSALLPCPYGRFVRITARLEPGHRFPARSRARHVPRPTGVGTGCAASADPTAHADRADRGRGLPLGPPPPADQQPAPAPPRSPPGPLRGRLAAPALATAVLLTATLAGWQILAATTAQAPTTNAAQVDPTTIPTQAPSPTGRPQAAAAPVLPTPPPAPAPAAPEPVVIDFGTRSEVGDGWRLAANRPYLCDVLMAIPVLQQDGTRIMRVTLTLTNRTGTPQPTRIWRLVATADATPAEFVLWPAEGFRGVPDMTLTPGQSVRFLVAIRVPEHRVDLRIAAERDAAPRAVLAGTL